MSFEKTCALCHRRKFLRRALAGGAGLFLAPGAFAEILSATPAQSEGPFYPDKLPLDTDNDLLIINDSITPAVGAVTRLGGVVSDVKGKPIRDALVEIWQVDNAGRYRHSRAVAEGMDENFQGYGRFMTDKEGRYFFRTIKPVTYPGRTPHIHFAVSKGERRLLTTQLYVEGEEKNKKDGIFLSVPAEKRKLLTAAFQPIPESKTGELAARFDLILGMTPEE